MLLFLFCAYLLLETGTRSVVLAVSICALLYIYYYCSAKQKIILSIIIPIIAIIILIIYADEMIFQRFMGGITKAAVIVIIFDGESGRTICPIQINIG